MTVHLLCGLVGAGKSTHARHLETDLPGVRFSLDEWMLRLYALPYDDPAYGKLAELCKAMIFDTARGPLGLGVPIILDWNHWSRERRRVSASWARECGDDVILHHVDTPIDVVVQRLRSRDEAHAHRISAADARRFVTIFEPPSAEEGIEIVRVHNA